MNLNLFLENLKAGDEVVVVFVNPSHTRDGLKYSGPKKLVLDEKRGVLRTGSFTGEIVPKDGKGYFFMSKRINPDYYFSANPKHLAAARKANQKRQAAQNKKDQILAEKRELINPLLETYRDREECYSFEYIPPETLERLTVKQLKTFVSWLK